MISNLEPNNVICRASFSGRMPKVEFYNLLVYIDRMKARGYTFEKHDRVDEDDYIIIDYVLILTK